MALPRGPRRGKHRWECRSSATGDEEVEKGAEGGGEMASGREGTLRDILL